MRLQFERVTRKHHHPRDSYEAGVEIPQYLPTYEHLQHEIERILEVIDAALEENSDLDRRA